MSEERDVLETAVKDRNAVQATINTKGWREIIKPALENRNAVLLEQFSNTIEYEEFVRIQQASNAIKNLLEFIENTLIEGDNALEELKTRRRPSS